MTRISRRAQPSVRGGAWGVAALLAWLLAAASAAAQPVPGAAAPDPAAAERQRYVEVAVALGCDALQLPLARQDKAREALSAQTLRRLGATRTRYAEDVQRFAGDAAAASLISDGLRRCPRLGAEIGTYLGNVKESAVVGQVRLSLTAEHLQGYMRLTIEGAQVALSIERHPRAGALIQAAGSAGGASPVRFTLLGEHVGKRIVGRLRLIRAVGPTLEIPVTLELGR